MAWKLKWHPDGPPAHPKPGDCWPWPKGDLHFQELAPKYLKTWAHLREPSW